MKTNYLFILLLLIFSYSFAQDTSDYEFNKNDFFATGTINHGESDILHSQLSVGYFINSNFALGVQSTFLVNESSNLEELSSFGMGINGKYFFTPTKRFSFFGELSLDYTSAIGHNEDVLNSNNNFSIQSNTFSAKVSGGINFFLTKKLALFAKYDLIQYDRSKNFRNTNNGLTKSNENNIDVSPSLENLNYGLLYKF